MAETFDALTYRVDVIEELSGTPYISGATTNAGGVDSIAKGIGVTADDRAKLNTALALEGSAEIVSVVLPGAHQFRIFVAKLPEAERRETQVLERVES